MLVMSPADAAPNPGRHGPDLRIDPFLGTAVHIVGTRQQRPNLTAAHPRTDCPFCPGGLEAPEPYQTRWFVNRWPALPDDRCEVVLYSPDHDSSLATLQVSEARQVVDLWAERTVALGSRADVAYVLIFENRGADVGATIAHPHGQIYAYDHVPPRPATMFSREWRPSADPALLVARTTRWTAAVPAAPSFPVALSIAPVDHRGALPDLDDSQRNELAAMLVDVSGRLDRLYGQPLPTMMWINQRPTDGSHRDAWLNIDLVSPWRAAGLPRYIAAAEIGGGEFFNPVVPEELAATLRRI